MLDRPLCFCPSSLPTPIPRRSPSLISHLASVDVKQHVYLLTIVFMLETSLLRNKPRCCTPGISCGLFSSSLDCILRCLSHCYRSMPHHTKNRLILKCLLVHLDNTATATWPIIGNGNRSRTTTTALSFLEPGYRASVS